jgi:hypothetical protein
MTQVRDAIVVETGQRLRAFAEFALGLCAIFIKFFWILNAIAGAVFGSVPDGKRREEPESC